MCVCMCVNAMFIPAYVCLCIYIIHCSCSCSKCTCNFCGWCLFDCGNSLAAHAHVANCPHKPRGADALFGRMEASHDGAS